MLAHVKIDAGMFGTLASTLLNCKVRYYDRHGRKRVCGGEGLKATQLYTPEFGRALATWWANFAPFSAGTETLLLLGCCCELTHHAYKCHMQH